MKILIACEYSGIVRDAFLAKGHDAISCDLLPTESPGPHYQGSVFDILYTEKWDMMIAHPPCQFLTYAGIGYFNIEKYGQKALDRIASRDMSFEFFMKLYNAPIPKICIENPRGYPMKFIKPTQMIHPFHFGEEHKKLTCLWLRGLLPLYHCATDNLFYNRTHSDEPKPLTVHLRKPSKNFKGGEIKKRYFTDSATRNAKNRAKFWPLVAAAMADQWG